MEKKVIELHNIKRNFQVGEETVHALRGISFTINEGEFVTIMGTSGSGKSTLLNTLGCLDTPSSGEYLLDGISVRTMSKPQRAILRNRKIGFVFQSYNLVPVLNVYENIVLPVELDGNEIDTDYVEDIIEVLGLEKKKYNLPSQLSGGQQQRVAIARAIASKPAILLADEPTGALDSKTGQEVLAFLQQLNREGSTVILITHDNGIAATARRIVRVSDGKIVEDHAQEVDWL